MSIVPLLQGWAGGGEAQRLGRWPLWFAQIRAAGGLRPAADLPAETLARFTAPRPAICGLSLDRPRVMGILNATPDSFSDGGDHARAEAALARVRLWGADVDLIDVGGESTRPGAAQVSVAEEIGRVVPVIDALRQAGITTPISIDTRKAEVAAAALAAGADMINDVSAFSFDPAMADLAAERAVPVCLMHAQGLPETMQDDPRYGDVIREVYDSLAARIAFAVSRGVAQERILADPGIGFGKTLDHNVALLQDMAAFHGLGVGLLLGVSRKGMIGALGGAADPKARMPGSLALALHIAGQGGQVLRVHDVAETAQALRLWRAMVGRTGEK